MTSNSWDRAGAGAEEHPADVLASAMQRLTGLLQATNSCFDAEAGQFAIPLTHVKSTLDAALALADQAMGALISLHSKCDLSIVQDFAEVEQIFENGEPKATPEVKDNGAESATTTDSGIATVNQEQSSPDMIPEALPELQLARGESTENTTPIASTTPKESTTPPPVEAVDKSEFEARYQDLMRKVTAAEIFAAEQQALSPPGTQHQLMPILKSLKEDLLKIHAAA